MKKQTAIVHRFGKVTQNNPINSTNCNVKISTGSILPCTVKLPTTTEDLPGKGCNSKVGNDIIIPCR